MRTTLRICLTNQQSGREEIKQPQNNLDTMLIVFPGGALKKSRNSELKRSSLILERPHRVRKNSPVKIKCEMALRKGFEFNYS